MRLFVIGLLSGLVFAPTFIFPALLGLAYLCYNISLKKDWKEAIISGFIFGFGHFLSGMYWISIGVTVYIEDFWWAIPLALVGLPLLLACFIASASSLSWYFRSSNLYPFIFSLSWIFFEWLRSWLFTGLPWNLIGYSIGFSEVLMQLASLVGVLGVSFCLLYIATSPYYFFKKQYMQAYSSIIVSSVLMIASIGFGIINLKNHPTRFSDLTVRVVQPSIPQSSKWDIKEFWENFNLQIDLSLGLAPVHLIIWSEAAMTLPYHYPIIKKNLEAMLEKTGAILITGGVTDNNKKNKELELYSSMYALDKEMLPLFNYHKSHLVPFGEYMPLGHILPLKKLTHGYIDYTEGKHDLVRLDNFKLIIKPLICYETIFPEEVRTSNKNADLFINITNDAWYGRSSGPYQHFYISLLRAVENGLPLIRVANNGISAVIDANGRIIKKLNLNERGFFDQTVPLKLENPTIYSRFGHLVLGILVIVTVLLQGVINIFLKNYLFFIKNS